MLPKFIKMPFLRVSAANSEKLRVWMHIGSDLGHLLPFVFLS
jgi:ArsR family metal-binding transcriptional regulator